uniref:Uncharacterized protein n=1 Tax=Caenorhabditis japonica TaxID=281687 RepID=A0A8R1INE0_CAEJA
MFLNFSHPEVTFHDARFLQRHIQTVHADERPRKQITITATSLLQCFKLSTATFYDLDGNEYRMGKHLESESDLAKHFKEKVVSTGYKLDSTEEKDVFIVEILGEHVSYVVLNVHEFSKVCDAEGKLKTLFGENLKKYEDFPKLERQM